MNEKPKILIADDSEINRALLKEILGDGYDYLEAEDGAAAVELMRAAHGYLPAAAGPDDAGHGWL